MTTETTNPAETPEAAAAPRFLFSLDVADFIRAFKSVHYARALGDARYALNGVYLDVTADGAHLAASDTCRLALHALPVLVHGGGAWAGLIAEDAGKMLKDSKLSGVVSFFVLPKTKDYKCERLKARCGGEEFIFTLIAGQFPRYRDVLPPAYKEGRPVLFVDRKAFIEALKEVGKVVDQEARETLKRDRRAYVSYAVWLSPDVEGNLVISSRHRLNQDKENATAKTVPAAARKCLIDAGVSWRFLVDALSQLSGPIARLAWWDNQNGPVRVEDTTPSAFEQIFMPAMYWKDKREILPEYPGTLDEPDEPAPLVKKARKVPAPLSAPSFTVDAVVAWARQDPERLARLRECLQASAGR